jgi:clan AA aspartic protease
MITGVILDNGTPVSELKVRGSHQEVTVEGMLDTGFTGFLCLPIFLAVPLGLALTDTITSELADGTIVDDELVFAGQAEWDGIMMDIAITLTRSEDVLIGTAFLAGYRVELDYVARTVSIEKVP